MENIEQFTIERRDGTVIITFFNIIEEPTSYEFSIKDANKIRLALEQVLLLV